MKHFTYNKDEFEFYMSDESCVQAWQVENGNVWTLEIFPPNQSKESFESAEYDGWLELLEEPTEVVSFTKPTYNKFDINYPSEWNEEMRAEFVHSLQSEINEIKVVDNNFTYGKIYM